MGHSTGEPFGFRQSVSLDEHKVVLPEPLRYSEDLDYVRATHGPIGPLLDAIREIADRLGMDVNTDVGLFPKVRLRAPFESGAGLMRVKIEINTAAVAIRDSLSTSFERPSVGWR